MYNYSAEALFALLHVRSPALANDLSRNYRSVRQGMLTVGLKLHGVDNGLEYMDLIEGLGGPLEVLGRNRYMLENGTFCLVLPPVGSAEYAIKLIECIEEFIDTSIFGNPQMQIQVCTPGRLSRNRAALLAIGFYLASERLRRFKTSEMTTTFADDEKYPRGKRLVLWDANGTFDNQYAYWDRIGETLFLKSELPFRHRTDILTGLGTCTRNDIRNINLFASLLTHSQYNGYWQQHGYDFEQRMFKLLEDHQLLGLTEAPWIHTENAETSDDRLFQMALTELTEYAFSEAARVATKPHLWSRWTSDEKTERPSILVDMQSLLRTTREIVAQRSIAAQGGGRT